MADALPAALATTVDKTQANEVDHPIMRQIVDALSGRSVYCRGILAGGPP